MNHSKVLEGGKYDENFKTRAHDLDRRLGCATRLPSCWRLTLEITAKNHKVRRVTTRTSPTSAACRPPPLVDQEMNIDTIQVYYDFGEAASASRCGWILATSP